MSSATSKQASSIATESSQPSQAVPSVEELRVAQLVASKKILVIEEPPVVVIEPGGITFFACLKDLWQHRELVLNLVARDLTTRYRQTLLGATWAVMQPMGLMIVLTLFYMHPVRSSLPTHSHYQFAVFSYASLILWQYFSASVTRATDSVLALGGILKKVYFPRLVAPIASVIPAAVDFSITFVLLIAMLICFHSPITWRMLVAPLFVMLAALAALGIGFWTSSLHVRYRDIFHLVPFMLQLMFFASPIIYPLSSVPQSLRLLYQLNPMVGAIEGFRWSVLALDAPILEPVMLSLLVGSILFVTGLFYFRYAERTFADYV